jgi:hypothetical protein
LRRGDLGARAGRAVGSQPAALSPPPLRAPCSPLLRLRGPASRRRTAAFRILLLAEPRAGGVERSGQWPRPLKGVAAVRTSPRAAGRWNWLLSPPAPPTPGSRSAQRGAAVPATSPRPRLPRPASSRSPPGRAHLPPPSPRQPRSMARGMGGSAPGDPASGLRASTRPVNAAAGAGRPRPGGWSYRPGPSPPSTHQALGSARPPPDLHPRETEAREGENCLPDPQS